MINHSFDRKHSNSALVGVGGFKCRCCIPSLRGKKKWLRSAKRRGKQFVRKSIKQQIIELS